MSNPLIYIISARKDTKVREIKKFCSKRKIKSIIITPNSDIDISLGNNNVIIGNEVATDSSIFFNIGLKPDYLAVPEYSEAAPDCMNIGHVAAEQRQSHLLSLLFFANKTEKYHVINPPKNLFDYISPGYFNALMMQEGFPTYKTVYTNSIEYFITTDLYNNNDHFIWSYPVFDAPEQLISKTKIKKLFDSGHSLPFIISGFIPGIDYSAWFFREKPLMGAGINSPENRDGKKVLESYDYILPNKPMKNLGKLAYGLNGLDFYQIRGVISSDGNLHIRRMLPLPEIMSCGTQGQKFLINILMKNIIELAGRKIRITANFPKPEGRTNIYLTRMLDPLFEIANYSEDHD